VPPGGAFDRESYELSLAFVGQANGSVLEIPILGGSFESLSDDFLGIAGAHCQVNLNGKELESNAGVPVRRGDHLAIGPVLKGARVYVASRLGWDVPLQLGSCSGLNPPNILNSLLISTEAPSLVRKLSFWPESLVERPLKVIPYIQARDSDLQTLLSGSFEISLNSDRVGIRMTGPSFEAVREHLSEPSCRGAIQLAPSGELLAHGPDGPTIGGYPKLGAVIEADLDRLAQLRPGDKVSFSIVSLHEARELANRHHRRLRQLLAEVRLGSQA
jgi:antagonist of KipI